MLSRFRIALGLALAFLAPAITFPAGGADGASPLDITFDLPAGGWAMTLLRAGGDAWGRLHVSWVIETQPGFDASVYVVPFAPIVHQPSWETPWPTYPAPIGTRGDGLRIEGGSEAYLFGGEGPDILVAASSSAPARVTLRYEPGPGVTLDQVARSEGNGASVDVEQALAPVGGVLAASVRGTAPGWLALDVESTRSQPSGLHVASYYLEGKVEACEFDGTGVATSLDSTWGLHHARGKFGTHGGNATIALAGATVPGSTWVSAVHIPSTSIGGIVFSGDYRSAVIHFGRDGVLAAVGEGCLS